MSVPLIIDLPAPPSVNSVWRSRQGKNGKPQYYLDGKYKAWKRECDQLCIAHGWAKQAVTGPYSVILRLSQAKRRGDCDNRLKATLDWLRKAGLTEDDSKCERSTAEWGEAPMGCRVFVFPAKQERSE